MRPAAVLDRHRSKIRELARKHRAENPRVFGSTATGQDVEGSDLDILVDRGPGATLIDLNSLQIELEMLLGVRVEVRTTAELSASIRSEVLANALPV